jgi:hypothetical protein
MIVNSHQNIAVYCGRSSVGIPNAPMEIKDAPMDIKELLHGIRIRQFADAMLEASDMDEWESLLDKVPPEYHKDVMLVMRFLVGDELNVIGGTRRTIEEVARRGRPPKELSRVITAMRVDLAEGVNLAGWTVKALADEFRTSTFTACVARKKIFGSK